jgi:hypothetical protein
VGISRQKNSEAPEGRKSFEKLFLLELLPPLRGFNIFFF